ncbi:MAG: polysaccharide deacetylase family protein [Clostridia bacterium]|nr:polysaccharide deacetylase family protein [Clostridia bacterium]
MKTNKKVTIISNLMLILVVAFTVVMSLVLREPTNAIVADAQIINGAYYSGNKNSKNVCLMINVYWGTEYLVDMLKILKEHNTKTTFFIGGSWASENPNILKQINEEGHEIASHGYYHKDHATLDYNRNKEEIEFCHKVVKEYTGLDMNLFAPPSGSYNKTTIEVAESLGYKTIMWTRDTIDWRDKDAKLIYNRAIKDIKGGDLILMHPTEKTRDALGEILSYIEQNNLIATTVSNTIA